MGKIIGYKKCQILYGEGPKRGSVKHLVLVTLDLTNACIFKSSKSHSKFRASKARVISIEKLRMKNSRLGIDMYSVMEQSTAKNRFVKTCFSLQLPRTVPQAFLSYDVGRYVLPDSFSMKDEECKNGIHFFLTKREAISF